MIDFIKSLFKRASILSTLLLLGGLGLLKLNEINTGDECVMDTYLLDMVKIAIFPFAFSIFTLLICGIIYVLDELVEYFNIDTWIKKVRPNIEVNPKVVKGIEVIYLIFMATFIIIGVILFIYATVEFLHWILFENLC